MSDIKIRKNDPYIGLLLAIVIFVFLLMVAACVVYRLKFDGGLSTESGEWSNFGSYMGGIFGPVVSLATLVAVLKTVYMQREMLDAQQNEFSVLAAKQDEQLRLAKSESDRARVQSYQAGVLNILASFTSEFRQDSNEQLALAEKARSSGAPILEGVFTASNYEKKSNASRQKVAELTLLALNLSIKEFSSVQEVQASFVPEMMRILDQK